MAHIDWQIVFNYFIENNTTTLADCAKHFDINVDYVRQVAAKNNWTAQKLKIQKTAQKLIENKAIEQIAKRNEEMAKMGKVLQGLGMEAIAEKQMKPPNFTEARKSIEAGIRLERQALNMDKESPTVAIQNNFNTRYQEGQPFVIEEGDGTTLGKFVLINGRMEHIEINDYVN